VHDRPELGICELFDLMVIVYRRPITREGLDAVRAAQRRIHDTHGKVAGLSVLGPQALERPDPSLRAAGQVVSDEFDQMAYASAIVLEESGMQGAFYRSVLTGIHLASRRPVQQRVFSELSEAIDWIVGKNAESPLALQKTEVRRRIKTLQRGEEVKKR
jgi:hypothetical protein